MSANFTPQSSRFLVPTIIALAIGVIGLNVGLFLTVNSHVQSIRLKEGEIDNRERAVTSAERELARIKEDIAQATERRSNAMQLKEDAEKSASDAQLQRQQRDQLVDQVRTLSNQRVGLDGDLSKLKNQIAESQEQANRANAVAKAALAQRDTDVARAQTEKDQLSRSIAELRANRERAIRDRDVAVKEAADATSLKNDRDIRAQELETVTQQLSQRKTESDRLAIQLAYGNSEEGELRKRRTSLEEQLKKLASDISVCPMRC
jgi:chromosome segregation ATPase